MTPRTDPDLLIALARYHRAMDAERRAFAEQVLSVVYDNINGMHLPGPLLASRIIEDLGPVYGRWYGRFPGDVLARWYRFTLNEKLRATAVPFETALQDIKRRVPAPIWRTLQREAV